MIEFEWGDAKCEAMLYCFRAATCVGLFEWGDVKCEAMLYCFRAATCVGFYISQQIMSHKLKVFQFLDSSNNTQYEYHFIISIFLLFRSKLVIVHLLMHKFDLSSGGQVRVICIRRIHS